VLLCAEYMCAKHESRECCVLLLSSSALCWHIATVHQSLLMQSLCTCGLCPVMHMLWEI
jgi:hypothetical protein